MWLSIGFLGLVAVLVAIDLGVLSRRPREVTPGEAAASATLWVLGAVGFGLLLARAYSKGTFGLGTDLGQNLTPHSVWLQFITAYATEIALSLDNVAVIGLVFAHFGVRPELRNRSLFWTIIASLVIRGLLIYLLAPLLGREWMVWVLASVLLLAALRTLILPEQETGFEKKWLVRLATRVTGLQGAGSSELPRSRLATPVVLVVLIAVAADISLAADSIPAMFAITHDPVIGVTSNFLAVLALRSIYFALSAVVSRMRFLKLSLMLVLLGLTAKTIIDVDRDELTTSITLAGIIGVVSTAVGASIIRARRQRQLDESRPTPLEDIAEAVALTQRNLRKVVILMAGTIIIIVAVIIAPLPGPGFIILAPIGLAVLATEFIWAKRLLTQMNTMRQKAEDVASRSSKWMVLPVVLAFWIIAAVLAHFQPLGLNAKIIFTAAAGGFLPIGYWAFKALNGPGKK